MCIAITAKETNKAETFAKPINFSILLWMVRRAVSQITKRLKKLTSIGTGVERIQKSGENENLHFDWGDVSSNQV